MLHDAEDEVCLQLESLEFDATLSLVQSIINLQSKFKRLEGCEDLYHHLRNCKNYSE